MSAASSLAANDAMTGSALRVLGVAYRMIPVLPDEINSEELEKDLTFVGLIGMMTLLGPRSGKHSIPPVTLAFARS